MFNVLNTTGAFARGLLTLTVIALVVLVVKAALEKPWIKYNTQGQWT